MADKELGISLRMIRMYDAEQDKFDAGGLTTDFDLAISLAIGDDRDIPMDEKVTDALSFIRWKRRQVH